jgi:hypothetical protein
MFLSNTFRVSRNARTHSNRVAAERYAAGARPTCPISNLPSKIHDPTILAILGLATVASISTVDIVASHEEDTRDFRAQHDDAETLNPKVEPADNTTASGKTEVPAR